MSIIDNRAPQWTGATDHACMKCNPGEIDRLNKLGAETSVGRYDETPTMGAYSSRAQGDKDRDVRGLGFASGHTERAFTRAEVLAVLKAQYALALDETATGEWKVAKNSAYRELIAIFERME